MFFLDALGCMTKLQHCFVHHIYTSMLIISLQEIPKENNGIDCGVFICQVLIYCKREVFITKCHLVQTVS